MSSPMDDRHMRNRHWLLQCLAIFIAGIPFFWFKFLLFAYAYVLLVLHQYIGTLYNGKNESAQWLWIPAICLFLVEPLNQVTFYMAKKDRKKAAHLKGVVFWILFTVYCVSDMAIRLHAKKTGSWVLMEQWRALLVLFMASPALPWYSLCPDIRFLMLCGQFEYGRGKSHEESKASSDSAK